MNKFRSSGNQRIYKGSGYSYSPRIKMLSMISSPKMVTYPVREKSLMYYRRRGHLIWLWKVINLSKLNKRYVRSYYIIVAKAMIKSVSPDIENSKDQGN